MLHILTSESNRDNDNAEGFIQRWDEDGIYGAWSASYCDYFRGGTSKPVSFKPLFGILNQPKYIPLSYCPITMELEIVNDALDSIVGVGGAFTAANTSTSWQIQDIRVVCDVVTLDSALQSSYAEHVLSGKALPINYSTYITQYQTITSSDFTVHVSRSA